MKELGVDEKGRTMVLTEDGKLQLVLPTGQSATLSRKHLIKTIAECQAELDKWKKYLEVLDNAAPQ